MKVDHISIGAKNTKSLADWYQNVLGIPVILEMKRKGRLPVYFIKPKKGGHIEIQAHSTWNPHICFEVEDFWSTVKKLVDTGLTIRTVRKTSIGWLGCFFEDLEGNKIEILYRKKPLPKSVESFEKNG